MKRRGQERNPEDVPLLGSKGEIMNARIVNILLYITIFWSTGIVIAMAIITGDMSPTTVAFWTAAILVILCYYTITSLKRNENTASQFKITVVGLIVIGCILAPLGIGMGFGFASAGYTMLGYASAAFLVIGILLFYETRDYRRQMQNADDAEIVTIALSFIGGFKGTAADAAAKDRIAKMQAETRRRLPLSPMMAGSVLAMMDLMRYDSDTMKSPLAQVTDINKVQS
jgi:hypothetical protein